MSADGDLQASLFAAEDGADHSPTGMPAAGNPRGASPAPDAGMNPAVDPGVPLSTRMRPTSLDELVGQEAALGPGTVLRRALEQDALPSLILWGPPGSGKTTLAGIIAARGAATLETVSAVTGGVADLRAAVGRAAERRRLGRRTVLFIDEIHRFSKAQQDAILPHVESGVVRLLGATTENPGFEVNAALLSRARIVRLEPLTADGLARLAQRALADPLRGLGATPAHLDHTALDALVDGSGGDARILLDTLEVAVHATRPGSTGARTVDAGTIRGALQARVTRSDKGGDLHFDLLSALVKSTRGSDADAAVYWTARLLEAGEDPVVVARRLVVLAAEDVGLADPMALVVAVAAQQAAHLVGMPEARLPLTEAALYLALAPKSNSVLRAYGAARDAALTSLDAPVPLHLRNPVTRIGRDLGHGAGYRYAHDHPGGVVDQEHLPEAVRGQTFFLPGAIGAEPDLVRRLDDRRRGRGQNV